MLKLYAQAAIYSPPAFVINDTSAIPVLPSATREKLIRINAKHCENYNNLSEWHNSLAAVVHPNYIQTLSLSMQLDMMVSDPFPFKPMGLVHIANQIDVKFLPEQNASLQLSTTFGEVYYHRRGWLFEVITQAKVDNVDAVKGVSFYLARHKHNERTVALHSKDNDLLPAWIAQIGHLKHHPQDASQKLEFSSDIGRRYAKVSGDYNPIHLYPYTAKLLGFSKAIAHGMYSKAWCVSKLAQYNDFYQGSFSIKTVFLQPIMLPLSSRLYRVQHQNVACNEELAFYLASNKGNKDRLHLAGHIEALK